MGGREHPVAAAGPLPSADLLRVAKSADAMGSTYSVELYGRDRAQLEDAADAALDEARRLDDLLSNYKPDSEWSLVNQRAAVLAFAQQLDADLATVAEAFQVPVAVVRAVLAVQERDWHDGQFGRREPEQPSALLLPAASAGA